MPDSRDSAEQGDNLLQSQFRNSVPNRARVRLHCLTSSLSTMYCFQGLKVTCRSRYGEIWLSSRCCDLVAGGFCALRNKRMQIGALNADTPARGPGVLYTSSRVHFSRRLPTMTHFGESGRRTSSSLPLPRPHFMQLMVKIMAGFLCLCQPVPPPAIPSLPSSIHQN